MVEVKFTTWVHEPPVGYGSWIIHDVNAGLPAIVNEKDDVAVAINSEVKRPSEYEEQLKYTAGHYHWGEDQDWGDKYSEIALYCLKADHPIYSASKFMPNAKVSSGTFKGIEYGPWIEHTDPISEDYPNTGFANLDDRVRVVLRDGWEGDGYVGDYLWDAEGDATIVRFAYEIHHPYYDTIEDITAQRQAEIALMEDNPMFGMF